MDSLDPSAVATPRTLWRDEAGGRHYLVPSDLALPPGPLLLRTGAAGPRATTWPRCAARCCEIGETLRAHGISAPPPAPAEPN